jgi:hypothetical protein
MRSEPAAVAEAAVADPDRAAFAREAEQTATLTCPSTLVSCR